MNNSLMSIKTEQEIGLRAILQRINTHTPYGKKAREQMAPFFPGQEAVLERVFDQVTLLIKTIDQQPALLRLLKSSFSTIKDITGSLSRVKGHEILNEIELFEIKCQVMDMNLMGKALQPYLVGSLAEYQLEPLTEIEALLDPEGYGVKSFYLYDSYSQELARLRKEKQQLEKKIRHEEALIHQEIHREIGIKPRPNGELHLPKAHYDKIEALQKSPRLYVASEGLQGIVFKIIQSQEVHRLQEDLENIRALEETEELRVRGMLSQEIDRLAEPLIKNINRLGALDLLLGKVLLAKKIKGCRPQLQKEPHMDIRQGRHPAVEEALANRGLQYTPVDLSLGQGITLITGANMGGKTVTLKLLALVAAMAQWGLFVPAEACTLGMVEFIHFSTGDNQSMESGLSTFGAEMKELGQALKKSQTRGLILIDELARGTNPQEGYAITYSVIEYLKKMPATSVITTHHEGLGHVEGISQLQVVGLRNVTLTELRAAFQTYQHHDQVLQRYMDFRLVPMAEPGEIPMEALKIAELMGIDEEVLQRAEEILAARLKGEQKLYGMN